MLPATREPAMLKPLLHHRRRNLLLLAIMLAALPLLPIPGGSQTDHFWFVRVVTTATYAPTAQVLSIYPLLAAAVVALVAFFSKGQGGSAVLILVGAGPFVITGLGTEYGMGHVLTPLPPVPFSHAWGHNGMWLGVGMLVGWLALWAGSRAASIQFDSRAGRWTGLVGAVVFLAILFLPVWPRELARPEWTYCKWLPVWLFEWAGSGVLGPGRLSLLAIVGGFYGATSLGGVLCLLGLVFRRRWVMWAAWLCLVIGAVMTVGGLAGNHLALIASSSSQGEPISGAMMYRAIIEAMTYQGTLLLTLLIIPIGLADLMAVAPHRASQQGDLVL